VAHPFKIHLEVIVLVNNTTAKCPTPPFINPLLLRILEGIDNLAHILSVKKLFVRGAVVARHH